MVPVDIITLVRESLVYQSSASYIFQKYTKDISIICIRSQNVFYVSVYFVLFISVPLVSQ